MDDKKIIAPSKRTAAKVIFAAFEILKRNNGQMPGKEVIDTIRETVEFTDWEKERYAKSGYIRWESMLHFFSVDAIKAGFLIKKQGVWYLTKEGESSMKLGPDRLLEEANRAYRKWDQERKGNNSNPSSLIGDDEANTEDLSSQLRLEDQEAQALEGIIDHIKAKTPYEFQEIVAALLRGMGYFTPFIAPKGRDGGIDIVAFKDPLGATTPRLKVQVKHYSENSISVDDIRSLTGLLSKDGDIGVFVTSSTFTKVAEQLARESHKQVRLIDLNEFITLWIQVYPNLLDDDKNLIPLKPVYFIDSND